MKQKLRNTIKRVYMTLYGIVHPLDNYVLFSSFCGNQYSDNPRAISEKLHELYPNIPIVWALHDKKQALDLIPDYVTVVPGRGRKFLDALACAQVFVTNEANESDIHKKKGQYFIQTWHGDRVPKKVVYDAWQDGKRPIPVIDNKVSDLCIAASSIGEKVYRSAFRYQGEVLKVGMPRNDCLVFPDSKREETIKNRLGLKKESKILLFAPTFRDNNAGMQQVDVDLHSTLNVLAKDKHDWKCLVRAHIASKGLDLSFDDGKLVDVSKYPDMADLLQISDVLITDYSSCAGDFILKRKPVILAMFDQEDYQKNCREFNFDVEEAGFLVVKNQEELEKLLRNKSAEDYAMNCESIIKYFSIVETGTSAEQICERIAEHWRGTIC